MCFVNTKTVLLYRGFGQRRILMLLFQHTTTGNLFLTEENVQKIMELLKDVVIENGVRVRILTSNYIHEQIERITGKQKIRMISKERERQKKQTETE